MQSHHPRRRHLSPTLSPIPPATGLHSTSSLSPVPASFTLACSLNAPILASIWNSAWMRISPDLPQIYRYPRTGHLRLRLPNHLPMPIWTLPIALGRYSTNLYHDVVYSVDESSEGPSDASREVGGCGATVKMGTDAPLLGRSSESMVDIYRFRPSPLGTPTVNGHDDIYRFGQWR
ncbi:unnamed protein product [Linum trigynum]|uniref:Uncharacterized protein n=1 Tax=Linum trigynum TaxID=586398 RepID=A0AAV2D499_9ROSI